MEDKAKRISYFIDKECARFNLIDWLEERDIELKEFEAFLRAGEKHFAEEMNYGKQ